MQNLKIGLLPLYLELYDRLESEKRIPLAKFYDEIVKEFEKRGIQMVRSPICRLKCEFAEAVDLFEKTDADALVTLHLAYSPSLECIDALASTRLPIIVLNTTPTFEYDQFQNPDEIMYNHGIHGVQDMCNLLLRKGKKYFIESGYWKHSDVLDRVVGLVRAVKAARTMRNARVGTIGGMFEGMGDFNVPLEILEEKIGIQTVRFDKTVLAGVLREINDTDVQAEMAEDLTLFSNNGIDDKVHKNTSRAEIAIRRWIEKERLTAFTMNFLAVDQASGLPAVPFLTASKAMARGTGYAGEGDVLTAALVGSLLSAYPETSFTEMFCADWKNDTVFISHMGEMNLKLADSKPALLEMNYSYTDAGNPAVAVGRFKGGKAVIVNLAPMTGNEFRLIVTPVNMLEITGEDKSEGLVRGWFRPSTPVADFLSAYSLAGGTHHSALVYGDVCDEIARFGEMMGWDVVRI